MSTVIDLLDTKGISWAEYQEDIPSSGFQGDSSGEYVAKHNPLISFDSITNNATRLSRIRSLTDFHDDLSAGNLPQWAFITPNEKNDGHDTGLAYGARWLRGWLEPLLNNTRFTNGTLLVVTFDETKSYDRINRVYTVLLGGAVDPSLRGTTDAMYYSHYSAISSVSANWGLPSLGRWDCGANVFSPVANRTGYANTNLSSYDGLRWAESYPGPLNDEAPRPGWWPEPATEARCASGKGVLASVVSAWGRSPGSYNYTSVYPYDDSFAATRGGARAVGSNDASSNLTAPPLPGPDEPESAAVTAQYGPATSLLLASVVLAWVSVSGRRGRL